jgi:hypothetical protein
MATPQTVLNTFAIAFPDCPASNAKDLFDECYMELVSRCELEMTEVDVSLVDGTREYSISAGIFNVYEAYYKFTSDTSEWRPLWETNIDTQATIRKGWRIGEGSTAGGPLMYYIASASSGSSAANVVGFDPIPDTTTVSGYPKVTLYCNKHVALGLSDTIPTSLLNTAIFTMGMAVKWCQLQYPEKVMMYLQQYENEVQKNVAHIKGTLLQRDSYLMVNAYRRRMI